MSVTRRDAMRVGAGALAGFAMPARAQHAQSEITPEQAIAAFVGDGPVSDGGVTLTLPDLAEDGYRVAVEIDAPGAAEVVLIAPGNPVPQVLAVTFGPMAVVQRVSTRMRLDQTQEVLALARMPDGRVRRATRQVDVVVGGCA
ncbi:thiosulfate oxidation carrier protein SoxY [Ruegeria sp. HKCCD8929]|uniref:thiosulfate oxidation carrier protein SoxY n=1 Tax=Ruegeria sp. HKCCD8929 TaxID=2683006 RepID=UPI00148893C5|nr:thiosulfate oxidation carrier protein SoxY [Ruegeria sp. HKCCD8929]